MLKSGAQIKFIKDTSLYHGSVHSKYSYHANQVLLAFNFVKDKYYCYDPEGRLVVVKGKDNLEKINTAGRIGHITQRVKLDLDHSLEPGNDVWIVGFSPVNKSAIIQLLNGKKFEIPQEAVLDIKEYYDIIEKMTEWYTIE
ncbi:MAG: hypothetical protein NZ455_16830 [Bacteroidia bacterium]|nr:hypothetical protein [Bacteroidia bacterium]MDW8348595.1 hypothetical protein [Bacteroidia bacterium]